LGTIEVVGSFIPLIVRLGRLVAQPLLGWMNQGGAEADEQRSQDETTCILYQIMDIML
jgi:hypothetical protein